MNKRPISIWILILTAISIFLFSKYQLRNIPSITFTAPNIERFEHKLESETEKTDQLAKKLLEISAYSPKTELFEKALSLKKLHDPDNCCNFFLYHNDTLIFWSSAINTIKPDNGTKTFRLLRIQNSYYLVKTYRNSEGWSLVALYRLYNAYPYSNRYLRNGFNPKFSKYNGYRVSTELSTNAYPVRAQTIEPFYLIPKRKHHSTIAQVKAILQWIALGLSLLAFIGIFSSNRIKKQSPGLRIALFALILIAARTLMLWLGFPEDGTLKLFTPKLYAHSRLNPSLGDFLVNAVVGFIIVAYTHNALSGTTIGNFKRKKLLLSAVTLAIPVLLFTISDNLFSSLILHSTLQLEAYRVFDQNIYSVIGYLAISLWFAAILLALHRWATIFASKLSVREILMELGFYSLVLVGLKILTNRDISWLCIGWMALTSVSMLLMCKQATCKLTLKHFILIASILAGYAVITVSEKSVEKELNIRRILAINLTSERDPLAEMILPKLYNRILTDGYIRHCVMNISQQDKALYKYLRKDYFKNYLMRYDLSATVCTPDSRFLLNSGSYISCNRFFKNMIKQKGLILPNSRFFYLTTRNGFINYLGEISYRFGNETRILYIELTSRPSWELLGYPELLIEEKKTGNKLNDYSWAKYHNNRLITQAGTFPYSLKLTDTCSADENFYSFKDKDYHHLIYRPSGGDVIIISRPETSFLNTTASFVYNLTFFLFILIVLMEAAGCHVKIHSLKNSFKNRITWAIISIILLSLLMVGSATIVFYMKTFDERNRRNISEKLVSIMFELDRDIPYIKPAYQNIGYLTDRLIELSNIFYSDINIYTTDGKLLATSREEMFEKKLLSQQMNPNAWFELARKQSPQYVCEENIGKASYLSAYVPILNANRQTIGYLNLPYFTRHDELRKELYAIIVAIINIYSLLALLAIAIALLISSQITRPLALIRERIKRVDIEGGNELIAYNGNDEVGELIREYNRMVKELTQSAAELAKNQRESAWREMARQIAHEVKNPLTPIKLSLQYLVKAKKEGAPDWDSRFERFAQSLSEQINTLTIIANEFSSFAKLPTVKLEELDLYKLISDLLTIYEGYRNIELVLAEPSEPVPPIMGDREQLVRVFNNLIKNGIQAIERGKHGVITITFDLSTDSITVHVSDNGIGISQNIIPKLFTPNFTTKSGGTGLGLAITREIIVGLGGEISVSTEQGKGSTFSVTLPRIKG